MKHQNLNRKLSLNKTTIVTFVLFVLILTFSQNYFLNATVRNSPKYEKDKNYQEWSAWGLDQKPDFRQYILSDGNNVGCGPCAWMNLIGWYDLNFTPSLLPGRTTKNNDDIRGKMDILRGYLPTKTAFGKRFVYPWHMGRGYEYYILKALGYTSLDFSEDYCKSLDIGGACGSKTDIIKVVEGALKRGYPVIVGLNRGGVADFWGNWGSQDHHYCIAYKFLQCLNEPYEEDPNWILVNVDYGKDVWINFAPVWGAWALGRLKSPAKDTYKERSNFAPAAAGKNTSTGYRLTWTGTDQRLNVMEGKREWKKVGHINYKNKVTFGSKVTIEERSLFKPAIVFFKNKFFVSWTGIDNFLYIMNLPGPNIKSKKNSVLEAQSICAPALTVFNNKLYCAWIDRNKKINIASSLNGTSWGGRVILNETSTSAPALASLNSKMYIAWRGTDSKSRLNIKISSGGTHFYGKQTFFTNDPNPTTDSGPSLCAHKGSIYIAWQGKNNNQINFMRNISGSNWGEKITLWDTCISGVDISSDGQNLIIVWAGTDEEHQINVQVEEGT